MLVAMLIEDGRVVGLSSAPEPVPEDAQLFDATGLIVAPGFIDLHLRGTRASTGDHCKWNGSSRCGQLDKCLCDAKYRSYQRQSSRHSLHD